MIIYDQERFEQVMSDLKTKVFPQIKTAIEGREKKEVVSALAQRVANIEAIIGDASAADADNIINKVVEFVAFFANITEDKTLAGMLATLKTELEAEIEHITFDSNMNQLKKTVNGSTSKLCDVVTSGFRISFDPTTGRKTTTAVGTATLTHDSVNGRLVYTF